MPAPRIRRAAAPCACARPDVLADRPDGTVVRHGDVVAKSHAPDTDVPALSARIAVAADPLLAGILLPPLRVPAARGALTTLLHGRPLSLWPYGRPVDPEDPDSAPWEDAGALLARLHAVPPGALPGPLPPMRGPAKAARAVARMGAAGPHQATASVLRAWARLPTWARDEAPASPTHPTNLTHPATPASRPAALCHGDLHLGQLVRHPAPDGTWLLIDVDDMGLGDPAWDLARPAAWYAAGLLASEVWDRFLGSYRAAGGPAVCGDGDPWPELDVPARALTVQTAALALAKSAAENRPLDEVEEMVIEACGRIAALPPEFGFETTS
ncbi:aminoglycoside phosphotransferase family protein [Streptomyces sp. H27-C3]|uniref:phosphotransferase family protein n=1 Tax=Streptomyces sp. H27-C3 TaxID=3046305 RepID=UPI0024BAFC96|nr:aminoglycoside phosphotransferase family protein [Streptomyces sp. H27-C3]MDJ0464853.1 aminoglycoside phosphotransferase family protein [Streptomyces sp. H27-C3]